MSTRKRGLFTCPVIAVLGLILGLAFVLPNPAGADSYGPLNPVADTWVDSFDGSLHGSTSFLRAANLYEINPVYYTAFLKFDLSSLSSDQQITKITLNLYDYSYDGTLGRNIAVSPADNDDWTEAGAPSGYNNSYQVNQVINNTLQYFSWDITSFKDFASDHVLSVAVWAPDSPTYSFNFYSRENGSNQPYLSIETSPVPLPGALVLLGSGLLGLLGVRRFGRD